MAKNEITNTIKDGIRLPIVAVMGHVDHGKTSILDAIRHTDVQAKEYGGITQHIGAYQITYKDQKVTFIDTPGHAAFTQMRARSGRAADICILVVAADEGVMPQTKEAIQHIHAAQVPMIVAINKMDANGADAQKIKQELASEGVQVEDWGGDVVCIEVSAKNKTNIDKLLDAILLIADLNPIKGSVENELEAVIIESFLDRKRGVNVSVIVRNGVLNVGDKITASGYVAKIKSLLDDKGLPIKSAGPSTPVQIFGFSQVPHVGDLLVTEGSELASLTVDENQVEIIGKNSKKTVAVVLKADTYGTLEAVKGSLANLVTSSVEATYALKFLFSGTGDVTESDVVLAQSSRGGVVIGFNVRIPTAVADLALNNKVTVKSYKTIYDLIDDAEKLLEGTALKEELKIKGRAQVLKTFKLQSGDLVAGSRVIAGALKPNTRVSVYDKDPSTLVDGDTSLYTGAIRNLKRGKDEVTVVGKDVECGVFLKPQFDDIKAGYWIEVL